MSENRLELSACAAGYDGRTVFKDLNIKFRSGETIAVLGPSGCGKSTLLKVASGLLSPLSGSVMLDGEALGRADRRVGVILQNYGLFPWLTVYENISLGLRIRGGYARRDERRRADEAVSSMMEDLGSGSSVRSIRGRLAAGSSSVSPSAGRWS